MHGNNANNSLTFVANNNFCQDIELFQIMKEGFGKYSANIFSSLECRNDSDQNCDEMTLETVS